MRPIDADALITDLYCDVPIAVFGSSKRIGRIIKYIEKRKTIDAVPVVRCKDCKYHEDGGACMNVGGHWDDLEFCSDGERRKEEGNA